MTKCEIGQTCIGPVTKPTSDRLVSRSAELAAVEAQDEYGSATPEHPRHGQLASCVGSGSEATIGGQGQYVVDPDCGELHGVNAALALIISSGSLLLSQCHLHQRTTRFRLSLMAQILQCGSLRLMNRWRVDSQKAFTVQKFVAVHQLPYFGINAFHEPKVWLKNCDRRC